jgi:hypothetical protein
VSFLDAAGALYIKQSDHVPRGKAVMIDTACAWVHPEDFKQGAEAIGKLLVLDYMDPAQDRNAPEYLKTYAALVNANTPTEQYRSFPCWSDLRNPPKI